MRAKLAEKGPRGERGEATKSGRAPRGEAAETGPRGEGQPRRAPKGRGGRDRGPKGRGGRHEGDETRVGGRETQHRGPRGAPDAAPLIPPLCPAILQGRAFCGSRATYDSSFRAQVAVPGGSRSLFSSTWERSLSARLRKLRLEFLPSSVKS